MTITYQLVRADEAHILDHVAPDVFDHAIDPRWSAEFLADPRHHLIVALDGVLVVGFVSALHYVHPDKAPECWINELGVAPSHQRRGIGRTLMRQMFAHAHTLGCASAWLLAEPENTPALRLYAALLAEQHPTVMMSFDLSDEPSREA
ncbi:GNAT family N-acetyltransferase [Chloroflexia bacterium SDU3-3]|nr:GNAT family N-acetyltransferase [Chloroflexia bacterium SDU3-3]